MFCYLYIFFCSRGVNPFGFGVMKTEHNFSLSRGYTVVKKLCPWLSWRVPKYSSCFFALFLCSLLKLDATVASYKTLNDSVM